MKDAISLYISFLLLLFTSCQYKANVFDKNTQISAYSEDYIIDPHLYEFILSRMYILGDDTIPAHDFFIEFVRTDKDTLFTLTASTNGFEGINIQPYYVHTDAFRLFILDTGHICSAYYNNDSIWKESLSFGEDYTWCVLGKLINGLFFEYFDTYMVYDSLFATYRVPPPR